MVSVTNTRGFTLVEVLVSIILIGLAVAALLTASNAFTMANGTGADISTAEFLVEQIRELTAMLAVVDPEGGTSVFGAEEANLSGYDDVDDFNGATFSPPVSTNRAVLNDFAAFSQQVTVENISPSNFEQVVAHHSSNFVRLTVRVLLHSREVTSASWVRARY